jgi:site-specific DNA-methyltransferase (adenine-specific)
VNLPVPYYADDLVTIYHGDCRDMLADIYADVIVTDPPYGISWQQHGGGVNGKTRGSRRHLGIVGDADTVVRDAVLAAFPATPAAVFGSFRAPFPAHVRQVLVYRRAADAGLMGSVTGFRRDADPIFLVGPWPVRDVRSSSVLVSRIGLQTLQSECNHPHAKPVDVLVPLIEGCPVWLGSAIGWMTVDLRVHRCRRAA